MHLFKGGQRGPIAPVHHLELKLEEEVIDTTMLAKSVGLPGDPMHAPAIFGKQHPLGAHFTSLIPYARQKVGV